MFSPNSSLQSTPYLLYLYVAAISFFCFATCQSQISFFGDVLVGSNTELYIAFPKTYFKGGIIYTDRNSSQSVVSFGAHSQWITHSKKSYVDGWVRIYHNGNFDFPLGNDGVFSPIRVTSLVNPTSLQILYKRFVPNLYSGNSHLVSVPTYHFWLWKATQGNAYVDLYWNPEHHLAENLQNSSFQKNKLSQLGMAGLQRDQWKVIPSMLKSDLKNKKYSSWKMGGLSSKTSIDFSVFQGLSFLIQHIKDNKKTIISQVITPNNDGINDRWKIQDLTFLPQSEIHVYNLNATLVYYHKGIYQNDWKGTTLNGIDTLQNGAYYYTIDIQGNGGLKRTGWIYIKRE